MTFISQTQLTATPYPGLRQFEPTEADIFFGREEQTDQLLKKLQTSRFLAVVGPSGCGKSSLVKAGMIPALEAGFLVDAGPRWRVAELRPGQNPLARVAEALASPRALGSERGSGADAKAFLQATLGRGPLGLVEALRETPLPERVNLLLLVDQFEEVFRFRKEGAPEEADAFVSLLLETARHKEFPVYVVITMRSDYLGDCAIFSGLPEALNDSQFLTPRLSREQSEAAIVKPARVFCGRLEPALVNRLLNDIGADPDQLPLLQHCLMCMWTSVAGRSAELGDESRTVTVDDYVKVGGLERALSNHANDILYNLTPEHQRIAEVMLRRLTERATGRGETRRDTRRPARLGDIADVARVSPEEVAEVVEEFRKPDRSFLMPRQGTPLTAETLIDISHESLIKLWDTLDAWATKEARSADFYERLKQTAQLWPNDAELWGGVNLERAVEWEKRQEPSPEWAARYGTGDQYAKAMAFLEASRKDWEATQRAESARLEADRRAEIERQAARRYKKLSVGLAFVCVLVAGLVVFAWRQNAVIKARSLEAIQQKQLAEASAAEADKQSKIATKSEADALEQKRKAEAAAKDAQEQKERAEVSARQAALQRDIAKAKEAEATRLKEEAQDREKEETRLREKAQASEREARDSERKEQIAATEAKRQLKIVQEQAVDLKNALNELNAYKEAANEKPPTNQGEQAGRLQLELTDVYGARLDKTVSVSLHNQSSGVTRTVQVDLSKGGVISGLYTAPRGVYTITVNAPSYRPVTQFVNVKSSGNTEVSLTLPVEPTKVTRVKFPAYAELPKDARRVLSDSSKVFGFEGRVGDRLYDALDDLRKASLLNVIAKALATSFSDERSVLSYIEEVREIRGDRFLAVVDDDLRDELMISIEGGDFRQVSGSLHQLPTTFPDYKPAGSFKTLDQFGALQITFFRKGDDFVADLDLDDASGILNVFQVSRKNFTGRATHPYDIHEILVTHQHLDPGYKIIP